MWKVCKYTLIDLARNRFMLVYTLLLLAISWGLFVLEGDAIKGLLALEQVVLALVPLIAVVFTVTYFHNSIGTLLADLSSRTEQLRGYL